MKQELQVGIINEDDSSRVDKIGYLARNVVRSSDLARRGFGEMPREQTRYNKYEEEVQLV